MSTFFKTLIRLFIIIIKLFLCLVITIFGLFRDYIILAIPHEFSWQILFYLFFAVIAISGIWVILFKKTKKITKLIFLGLFITYFLSPKFLPSVMKTFQVDSCLSGGICTEGLEINTEHGRIEINRENCLKYNWQWNENRKWCDVRGKNNN